MDNEKALALTLLLEGKCIQAIIDEGLVQGKTLTKEQARTILGKIGSRIVFGNGVYDKAVSTAKVS